MSDEPDASVIWIFDDKSGWVCSCSPDALLLFLFGSRASAEMGQLSLVTIKINPTHDSCPEVSDERAVLTGIDIQAGNFDILYINTYYTEVTAMAQSPFMIRVRESLRLRQMAYATEKTYCHWIRYFILQQSIQHPDEMVAEKVIEFLTYLAVQKHVSPNTQNQAFNALLFI